MKKTKTVFAELVVCFVFCFIAIAGEPKMESKAILDKVEKNRLDQSPEWVLQQVPEHRTGPVSTSYKWTFETNYAEVAISVLGSASEAEDSVKQARNHIPTKVNTVADLGDEAFVSQSAGISNCMIIVRKTNVVIQVNASSLSQGEKWSRLVVEQISQSAVVK